MKKTWIVFAMLAALCASACDDDNEKAVCTDGQKICDSAGHRYICSNNAYVISDCAADRVCDAGNCTVKAQCTEGVPTCVGNTVQYCNNGMWKYEACPADRVCNVDPITGAFCQALQEAPKYECKLGEMRCSRSGIPQVCQVNADGAAVAQDPSKTYIWANSGECKGTSFCLNGACQECSNGDVRCNGDDAKNLPDAQKYWYAQKCENGKWINVNTCNAAAGQYCMNGNCHNVSDCIVNGSKQCGASNAIQECQNGSWVTTAVCNQPGADRCLDAACVDKTVPVSGDACDSNTTKDSCKGNTLTYCENNKYVVANCSTGTSCLIGSDGVGDCYMPCSKAGETVKMCEEASFTDGSTGYATFVGVCKSIGNSLGLEIDYQQSYACSAGCNATGDDCGAGGSPSGTDTPLGSSNPSVSICSASGLSQCQSMGAAYGITTTCIAEDGEDAYCAETCTKANDVEEYCYDGVMYHDVCKSVGSSMAYVTDYPSSYKCGSGACNADGTACGTGSSSGGSLEYCGTELCGDGSYTCDEACAEAYGSTYKAYCDSNNKVTCSTTDISGTTAGGDPAEYLLGTKCTEAGKKVSSCGYDDEYGGFFTDRLECREYGTYGLVWYPYDGTYDSCIGKCTSDGTQCDSSGKETYEYTGL